MVDLFVIRAVMFGSVGSVLPAWRPPRSITSLPCTVRFGCLTTVSSWPLSRCPRIVNPLWCFDISSTVLLFYLLIKLPKRFLSSFCLQFVFLWLFWHLKNNIIYIFYGKKSLECRYLVKNYTIFVFRNHLLHYYIPDTPARSPLMSMY